jgi:hypothetical protein
MSLIIPTPALYQKDSDGIVFASEKPVNLSCGEVLFSDGRVLPSEGAEIHGFLLFRQTASGSTEVWDDSTEAREWKAGGTEVMPSPLAFYEGKWQTIFVASGQKDKDGKDKFALDQTTKYFVRLLFAGIDEAGVEQRGVSVDTSLWSLMAPGTANRAGLTMEPPDTDPSKASEVRLFLKDAGRSGEKGTIAIREKTSGFEIEVTTNGARILLTGDGSIELSPAPSKQVTVLGNIAVHGTFDILGALRVNGTPVP